MAITKSSLAAMVGVLIGFCANAQQVIVNTVGKDPFVGKSNEVTYKAKEGVWTFQGFSNTVIKATYKPADYSKNEQVSDAVIAKILPVNTKVTVTV